MTSTTPTRALDTVAANGIDDSVAALAGKLVNDLDAWIRSLQQYVRPSKPWQRVLLMLLGEADGRMQILRMTLAMDKSVDTIVDATGELAATCQRVNAAVRGSRADAMVRTSAFAIAKTGDALNKIVIQASAREPALAPMTHHD